MSKIFEALKKTEGEVSDLALPMLTQDSASGGAALVEDIVRETAAAPETDAAVAEHVTAAHASSPGAQPLGTPVTAQVKANGTGIRTVSIHLALNTPVLPFDDPTSQAGEQYRVARTKLVHHPRKPQLIVISSAGSGDGKTVTSINLAGALSLKSDEQILLVDGDLRRSQIARMLGIHETPGLADVLNGTCLLNDAIVRVEQFPNFCVLPGGKPVTNPTELLDSSRLASLCASVRRQFKYVIFDAPPMATVADYELIQAHCDGVVMVVRPDHSNRKLCLKALDTIPKERLVGVLMNCVRDWFLWKTREYHYYTAGS